MLLEIHTHSSQYSKCSHADPVALVKQAEAKGMQGIVITEHRYQWKEEDLKELKTTSEVNDSFLILSAQETVTDIGHVLVYGADEIIDEDVTLNELRERFPDAALVWAHPFRNGKLPSKEELTNPLLDAVEIFNINHNVKENYLALSKWHEYKFTAVSGSDAHSREAVAIFPTEFYHPVASVKDIAREIKKGRCKPFLKEVPKAGSNLNVMEITMGTKGSDEVRTRLIVKKIADDKKWEKSLASLEVRQAVYDRGFHSGKFRVPKTIDVEEKGRLIIEEGQRGSALFDVLGYVNHKIGIEYLKLTAQWLAGLHKMKLAVTDADSAVSREKKRLHGYADYFAKTNNPHTKKIESMVNLISAKEAALLRKDAGSFVQCHGDYHPKNILIGQDRLRDFSTLFVSVIDFDNSILLPPAFDVGYFLAQFAYQFHSFPEVIKEYKEDYFLEAYKAASADTPEGFDEAVRIFKTRANLSIASYLIKVGKGESRDMEGVLKSCLV
jgi:hypothetical protein